MAAASQTDTLQDRDVKETAKREANALWNDTKGSARSVLGEQQKSAASGVADLASALRKAAREMPGGDAGRPPTSRLIESAADGLERFSDSLKNRDLNDLVGQVESFAQRQPVVFFGAAVAAGFLAMRFLKASNPPAQGTASPARDAGNVSGNLPF